MIPKKFFFICFILTSSMFNICTSMSNFITFQYMNLLVNRGCWYGAFGTTAQKKFLPRILPPPRNSVNWRPWVNPLIVVFSSSLIANINFQFLQLQSFEILHSQLFSILQLQSFAIREMQYFPIFHLIYNDYTEFSDKYQCLFNPTAVVFFNPHISVYFNKLLSNNCCFNPLIAVFSVHHLQSFFFNPPVVV